MVDERKEADILGSVAQVGRDLIDAIVKVAQRDLVGRCQQLAQQVRIKHKDCKKDLTLGRARSTYVVGAATLSTVGG